MEKFFQLPPTIKGEDGVLRCSKELDPLPNLDCSIALYLMQILEKSLDEGRDGVLFVDAKAGEGFI